MKLLKYLKMLMKTLNDNEKKGVINFKLLKKEMTDFKNSISQKLSLKII